MTYVVVALGHVLLARRIASLPGKAGHQEARDRPLLPLCQRTQEPVPLRVPQGSVSAEHRRAIPAPDTQRFPQTAADTRDVFLPPPFHRLSEHRSVRIAKQTARTHLAQRGWSEPTPR